MSEITLERIDQLWRSCEQAFDAGQRINALTLADLEKALQLARQALSQGDVVWEGECLLYGRSMAEVNLLTSIHNLFPDCLDECEQVHVTIRRPK